ncbi:alanine racemase [Synechococcus sp. PCC 7336]|uniref:alanine racemase n=1 Tax=Synechococcus sp. PCC 7336 TaxID=195250 RepID=UPI00034C9D49|nr:alanine racemase [Synechococcus sp. PCC 7336]
MVQPSPSIRPLAVLPHPPTWVSAGAEIDDAIAMQRAWVEIDLGALRHNIRALMGILQPETELWAVVKANAYGHGAIPVAQAAIAAGAAGLCAATLHEGLELRQAGISAPVLLLGALRTAAELRGAMEAQLELTITDPEQIELCQRVAAERGCSVPVHLKVDTGMSRLGVAYREAADHWRSLVQAPLLIPRSLYSHFATADEPDCPTADLQHRRFEQVIQGLRARKLPIPPLHMANSAATLANPDWHYQRVRVGLALYGVSPAEFVDDRVQLRPVLSLKARVVHLKQVPAGTGVSYGHRYVTEQPTRIATVAIGYADGVPRRLSGQLRGVVRGQRLQQVGNVTMDQTMWVIPSEADVRVGDVVDLLGGEWDARRWAEALGTIPYEVLCGLSARLPRRILAAGAISRDNSSPQS